MEILNIAAEELKLWTLVFGARGSEVDILTNNSKFQITKKCMDAIAKKLANLEADKKFLNRLCSYKDNLKILFSIHNTDIDKLIAENKKLIDQAEQMMTYMFDVMKTVQCCSINLPIEFNRTYERIIEIHTSLLDGTMCAKLCSSLMNEYSSVSSICQELKIVIPSNVFWNLLRDNPEKIQAHDKSWKQSDKQIYPNLQVAVDYLKKLHLTGLDEYNRAMQMLPNDDISVSYLLHIFDSTSISQNQSAIINFDTELEVAAVVLKPLIIAESIWTGLKRLFSFDDVKHKVVSMQAYLHVFEVTVDKHDGFSAALQSFEKLVKGSILNFKFKTVRDALKEIHDIIDSLSSSTFEIMEEIGKSPELVVLLKDTGDDDLRNIIDAVDDISEYEVCESTVSGLVDIKQLFSFASSLDVRESCTKWLEKLDERIKQKTKSDIFRLKDKITECSQNVNSLKKLYTFLADRGERMKNLVECIHGGIFKFSLTEQSDSITVQVVFKQNEREREIIKDTAALIDLRSRSLLLMNTERNDSIATRLSSQQLKTTVAYIDDCIDLSNVMLVLHMSGHFSYICTENKVFPKELENENERLKQLLRKWKTDLSSARRRYFLMNYISGFGIQTLYRYLNNSESKEDEDTEILVQTILAFIHPSLKATSLKHYFQTTNSFPTELDDEDMLICIGQTLHKSYAEDVMRDSTAETLIENTDVPKITDVVQEGKVLVAHLDKHSLNTIKTVLAIYINTIGRLPTASEILFCTNDTVMEEIELHLNRCLGAITFFEHKSLFCLANVELLSHDLMYDLVDSVRNFQERNKNTKFLLAIVCRGSITHHIIEELMDMKGTITPITDNFLKSLYNRQRPRLCTVTSDTASLGKTTLVVQESHRLKKAIITYHISGNLRKLTLVERLRKLNVKDHNLLHIDVRDVDNLYLLDTFLFELTIVGYIASRRSCVSLGTEYVYLEIENSINNVLCDSLVNTLMYRGVHLTWHDFENFVVSKEKDSSVQIVCHYLRMLEKGILDEEDLQISNSTTFRPLSTKTCQCLVKKYFRTEDEMTFSVINTTLDVLADQLKKLSSSPFFKTSRLQDMIGTKAMANIKSFIVSAMIKNSIDFASRSIKSCRDVQESAIRSTEHNEFAASASQQVDSMVRWEDSNHLMFVFHSQNIQTLSLIYRCIDQVPVEIKNMFKNQLGKVMHDFDQYSQQELEQLLVKIARVLPLISTSPRMLKLSNEYALTPDNILKMVLIILRIRANIPVIVMGETGCGKTSLVHYLAMICEVPLEVINIHAGVTEDYIVEKVVANNAFAQEQLVSDRWLFFDEVNTSESVGVISEIICHRTCLGKSLSPNLIVMGACNPYRLKSNADSIKAGLNTKPRSDELSKLVYRVLPLPQMMTDYVWDFGVLSKNDERIYIRRMIDQIDDTDLTEEMRLIFVEMISESQTFIRSVGTVNAVSLRDVSRCILLFEWFVSILQHKIPTKPYTFQCSIVNRAMVLTLAHCYHCRIISKSLRKRYRYLIGKILARYSVTNINGNSDYISTIIDEEQKDFLSRMNFPEGTACNSALMENVYIILVCIFNRLPIFVVGKPGCSKSLAIRVIRGNIRGKDSVDKFFRTLPQLLFVSFQGSKSSTSGEIAKVFEKAETYRLSDSDNEVLPVVILDEVGLAEISPFNPLKILHSLLEPFDNRNPNVAVVGLSNWSLDASKMNRAVHLSRTDMDEEELYKTALAISDSFSVLENSRKDKTGQLSLDKIERKQLDKYSTSDYDLDLRSIAHCYFRYAKKIRFKNFHGLRDYYALVKFVVKTLKREKKPTPYSMEKIIATVVFEGLERNFGGLPSELSTLYEEFNARFDLGSQSKSNVLDLISKNVRDPIARHLLLITSGNSALCILEHQLNKDGYTNREVICGSQFEDDMNDDYNYRILSQITLCMEEGLVLILHDLENIYGSLYDMLNQTYTIIGNKRYCRIALGAYSNPVCPVAERFRCIVLVDEVELGKCDPPFINRFEKQHLRFADIVDQDQRGTITKIEDWIGAMKYLNWHGYENTDLFPIYSGDILPSLALKAEAEIRIECSSELNHMDLNVFEKCKRKLLWLMKPEAVVRLKKTMSESLRTERKDIQRQYFKLPLHNGIAGLIDYQYTTSSKPSSLPGNLTILFTNSNIHTKLQIYLHDIRHGVQIEKLGTFKSEKQLSSRVRKFWSSDTNADVLLIQCSAADDEKHINLTKSIVEKFRNKYAESETNTKSKQAYLIIHLSKGKKSSNTFSFINFMSDWNLVMMDTLECPQIPLQELCSMGILETIRKGNVLERNLKDHFVWAFSRIKYSTSGRSVKRIMDIIKKMEHSSSFLKFLKEEIWKIISKSENQDVEWQLKVACDLQALNNSASFVDGLEQYASNMIKTPLAKIIYGMEKVGILDSFFSEALEKKGNDKSEATDKTENEDDTETRTKKQSYKDKTTVFRTLFRNSRIFSIQNVLNETGPECYPCETPYCNLRMPFSRIIYSYIESQRDEFLEELSVKRGNIDLSNNEILSSSMYSDLVAKQEQLAVTNIPDCVDFFYFQSAIDYFHDFCSMLSSTIYFGMDIEKRTSYMKWIMSQKVHTRSTCGKMIQYIVCLHTTAWINLSLFRAELQLLGTCEQFGIGKLILKEIVPFSQPDDETDDKELYSKPSGHDHISYETEYPSGILTGFQFEDSSSEGYTMRSEDILVQNICKRLIPAKSTLTHHGGITAWQRTVTSVLALITKVSTEPKELFSLKVCNEVASDLIIPACIEIDLFENLGELLHGDKDLDSKDTYTSLFEIIQHGLKRESNFHANCYRVFSSYLVRCLLTDNESAVINYLFMYVYAQNVSKDMVVLFRAPLYIAFDLEDDILSWLKCTDYDSMKNGSLKRTIHEDNENEFTGQSHSGEDLSSFAQNLDRFLKAMDDGNRRDSPFVLLIVDILATLFEKQLPASPDGFQSILNCHKILRDGKFGTRYVASIAYLKTFFTLNENQILYDTGGGEDVWKTLNVILADFKTKHASFSLVMLLLKTFGKRMSLSRIKIEFNQKQAFYPFLESIPLSEGSEYLRFEHCALCTLSDREDHQTMKLCRSNIDYSSLKNQTKEIFEKVLKNPSCLQIFLSFTAKEFYFLRSNESFSLSKEMFREKLIKGVSQLNPEWIKAFQLLSGDKDFTPELRISDGTSEKNNDIRTFLIHFFIFLLAETELDEDHTLSVFVKCLLFRPCLSKIVFPGFIDHCGRKNSNNDAAVKIATCCCGNRMAVHEPSGKMFSCVFCNNTLEEEKLPLEQPAGLISEAIVWMYKSPIDILQFQIRSLHPVTAHIIQMLTKSCLLGSLSFGYSSLSDLKTLTGIELNSALLWNDIICHWHNVGIMLNLDESYQRTLFLAMLTLFKKSTKQLEVLPMTDDERRVWEDEFENIVRPMFFERYELVKNVLRLHNKIHGINPNSVEQMIFEVDDIEQADAERQFRLPLLFRINNKPSSEHFKSQFFWKRADFPFLDLILQYTDRLKLPKHILSIVQWHATVAVNASYVLKRRDCLKMTVEKFIASNPKTKKLVEKRFNSFKKSWNKLSTELKGFHSLCRLHKGSSMEECIMHNETAPVYKVMKKLVDIQNEFLNKVLIIAGNCKTLKFLFTNECTAVFPCVQLTELKKEDLLYLKLDEKNWADLLEQESQCHLQYGSGREIIYNFPSLEKQFALRVLTGKSYIDVKSYAPTIVFVDELYRNYADLVNEFKLRVPQKPLTQGIKDSIEDKSKEESRTVHLLLTHLGILMTLLKKTGGDPNMSILDYTTQKSNILIHEFPVDLLPGSDSIAKLCHIVALTEMLEEMYTKDISLENALDSKYIATLDSYTKQHIIQVTSDMKTIPAAKLVLSILRRFTYRCLFTKNAEPHTPVCHYLSDDSFWPEGYKQHDKIIVDKQEVALQTLLPEDIMVCHVPEMIKHMSDELQKQDVKFLKTCQLGADFITQSKQTPVSKEEIKQQKLKKYKHY